MFPKYFIYFIVDIYPIAELNEIDCPKFFIHSTNLIRRLSIPTVQHNRQNVKPITFFIRIYFFTVNNTWVYNILIRTFATIPNIFFYRVYPITAYIHSRVPITRLDFHCRRREKKSAKCNKSFVKCLLLKSNKIKNAVPDAPISHKILIILLLYTYSL